MLLVKKGDAGSRLYPLRIQGGNNAQVDASYRAAMAAGAMDNISPRARVEYCPGYYAADVFDPDGYSFEIVNKS